MGLTHEKVWFVEEKTRTPSAEFLVEKYSQNPTAEAMAKGLRIDNHDRAIVRCTPSKKTWHTGGKPGMMNVDNRMHLTVNYYLGTTKMCTVHLPREDVVQNALRQWIAKTYAGAKQWLRVPDAVDQTIMTNLKNQLRKSGRWATKSMRTVARSMRVAQNPAVLATIMENGMAAQQQPDFVNSGPKPGTLGDSMNSTSSTPAKPTWSQVASWKPVGGFGSNPPN